MADCEGINSGKCEIKKGIDQSITRMCEIRPETPFKLHRIFDLTTNTHHLLRFRVVWIFVRVIFQRKLPVLLLDFLIG